jgi:uncharacterized protein YndB with AHSA1/START domain
MRIVKWLVFTIVTVAAILALVSQLLPRQIHVERSAEIAAPPATVFALLADMRRFNEWSPWVPRDPQTQYEFSGPPTGVGAKMAWRSEDPGVGTGVQEIVAADPDERIEVALDFGDNGTGLASYRIEPAGTGSKVTWGFDTDLGRNPIARFMGLMFDEWIGADYEAGLAAMREVAEDDFRMAEEARRKAGEEARRAAEEAARRQADEDARGGAIDAEQTVQDAVEGALRALQNRSGAATPEPAANPPPPASADEAPQRVE